MAKRVNGRPPLIKCFGCRRHYRKVHQCPAADWKCRTCKQLGHYNGFCKQRQNQQQWHNDHNRFKFNADTFNFPHENLAYPNPYEPVKLEEFCETMGRGASCDMAYEGATQREVKQEHHTHPGMFNTKKRSAEHSEPCNEVPGQKRRRHNDTLNFFKGRVETLREENQALKQQRESQVKESEPCRAKNTNTTPSTSSIKKESETCRAKNTNTTPTTSSTKKESETSRAEKTDEFKPSLNKPLSELIAEFEDTKAEHARLKAQRDQLFECYQKLETHSKKVANRVDHLTAQHRYIMDRSYIGFPTANLPPWCRGRCRRCGSAQRHEEFDCAARGYMCQQCFKFNHFTAVCSTTPSHRFTSTPEEKALIAGVKAVIAASK